MTIGRPTKYNAEIQAAADRYLAEYKDLGQVVPTVVGMALSIGVSKATIYTWTEAHPEFLNTVRDCAGIQERELITGGLNGKHNSTIAKLLLHNHGHNDKVSTDVTSSDGSMSPKDHSQAILDALSRKHDT